MLNNKTTILITGIGAIIGQGIIKSLKDVSNNINIIGLDKNINIYTKKYCDLFIKKPEFENEYLEYFDFWELIIKKYDIKLIIPTIDIDINFFNKNRIFFQNKVKIVLNNQTLIDLCNDKWAFYNYLNKKNLKVLIPSILPISWENTLKELNNPPFILKPRNGSSSQGIVTIHDQNDFIYWTNKQKNCLIQKLVGTELEEYTVGVFGLNNGNILNSIIIFKRTLSKEGNTKYAEVINNQFILDAVINLSKILEPIGPTNFQFRVENNSVYLLEINPRLSSSNSLRTLFGYNEALMIIDYYIKNKTPNAPKIKNGKAWRYYEDKVCFC